MRPPESTEVLIVGAGPTGLTLACALRQRGIDCVVVEPEPSIPQESRAVALHAGSLERLHLLGVADELVAAGVVAHTTELRNGRRVLARNEWHRLPSRFPMLLLIPQWQTSTVLERRVCALDGTIARGWRFESMEPGPGDVAVAVTSNDARETVRATFVAACDGAHSDVRHALNIRLAGASYPETFMLADLEVRGLDAEVVSRLFVHGDGPMVLASLPGGLLRMGAVVDERFEASPSGIQDVLTCRSRSSMAIADVAWSSVYRVHRRVADRMRMDRIVLAGDAAHVHSPVGGQGVNLGIRDAFDLGARLAAILGESAPLELLDDYERVRQAEAARVLASTDRLTRMVLARGLKRRVIDAGITVASRVGGFGRRVTMELSGLDTPWPPGTERPAAE